MIKNILIGEVTDFNMQPNVDNSITVMFDVAVGDSVIMQFENQGVLDKLGGLLAKASHALDENFAEVEGYRSGGLEDARIELKDEIKRRNDNGWEY